MSNLNNLALAEQIQMMLASGADISAIAALLDDEAKPSAPAAKEDGLYTGRPAYDAGWGLPLQEAFEKARLGWKVGSAPTAADIVLPNGEKVSIPGQNILYRDDNGFKLGDVGDKYHVFQNEQGKELVEKVCGKDCTVDTIGTFLGGKKVYISVRTPEELKILGDEFKYLFLMAWGHDGSTPLNGGFNGIRVFCQNTLAMAVSGLAESPWRSIPHKSGMQVLIKKAMESWQNRVEVAKASIAEAEMLAKIKFSENKWNGLVDTLFPLEEGQSKRSITSTQEQRSAFYQCLNAEDLANHIRTGWGFIQAATDFADHTRPIRQVEGWEDRRAWESMSGSPIVTRAKELVLAYS